MNKKQIVINCLDYETIFINKKNRKMNIIVDVGQNSKKDIFVFEVYIESVNSDNLIQLSKNHRFVIQISENIEMIIEDYYKQ